MKLKILTSCSGLCYSYAQGDEVDVKSEIAKDLIQAGYAVELKEPSSKAGAKDATTK